MAVFRPPWHQTGLPRWLFYYIVISMLAPIMLVPFRMRWKGLENVPRSGSFLLLGNHSSLLDPFWDFWLLLRPAGFMASAQLFRTPVAAWLLDAVGVFPKKKFVKDRASMEVLNNFIERGQPVGLFPEGTRSFDGRIGRVLPGIGRLTKRLDTSLVFVRNTTGHLCLPRWAVYPRFVPIHLEYEGPISFPPEATAEEIAAFVKEKITIQHDRKAPRWSFGFRMAHGLPVWLWACPQCFELDSLSPAPRNGNVIRCHSCQAAWRVDVSCRLSGRGQTPDTTVWVANDAVIAHFGNPPVADRARFAETSIILDELGSIGELKRGGTPQPIGSGRLTLLEDRMALFTPDGVRELWSLPLPDIVAISVEISNLLQIRTTDSLYQIAPSQGSTIKWAHFMRPWCTGLRKK